MSIAFASTRFDVDRPERRLFFKLKPKEKMKYFTNEEIQAEYNKLSKDRKILILYNALDYMSQYNGRSKFKCIAMAMGYDNTEGLNSTYFKAV